MPSNDSEMGRAKREIERLRTLVREVVKMTGDAPEACPVCGLRKPPHNDGCPWPELVTEAAS